MATTTTTTTELNCNNNNNNNSNNNSSNKYVLDKPLHLLTEDDISQLTREDCRRYLKEKGMRRPSWNKSQAIQQVISLKSLLEPSPPKHPGGGVPRRFAPSIPPPPPTTTTTTVTSNSSSSGKELSTGDLEGSVSASALAENGSPSKDADLAASEPAKDGECHPAGDSKPSAQRCEDGPQLPIGQMTIFYSGKVNVYDGVPVDKQAQSIMHIAAGPIQICQEETSSGNSTHWSSPAQFPVSNLKFNVSTSDAAPVSPSVTDVEGQSNRQVSLQRYFEKRKDRGKFKVKRKIGSSSGLEVYLNHQIRPPAVNGQPTESNARSPGQFGVPCTAYGFLDQQSKNTGLSVDLNEKDVSPKGCGQTSL